VAATSLAAAVQNRHASSLHRVIMDVSSNISILGLQPT
jgi:hypothetical protein